MSRCADVGGGVGVVGIGGDCVGVAIGGVGVGCCVGVGDVVYVGMSWRSC